MRWHQNVKWCAVILSRVGRRVLNGPCCGTEVYLWCTTRAVHNKDSEPVGFVRAEVFASVRLGNYARV